MRIGCLQFAPQVGDVENNLNRADAVLSKANPQDLDLLVLPELAFSGYNFKSLQHISPYLEPTTAGITSLWARTMALKYNCVVTVGYPEKVDVTAKWPTSPEYYNSAITVNAEGETIANYRKSFLYYTDETWALEGPDGFFDGEIEGLGNVAMGICKWPTKSFERMDLNPYRFEAPWSAWEFAYHILHKEANLVILSMAWLTREDARSFSRAPKEPDMETLSYWLARLEPVIRAETEGEIIVVIANRCGTEEEAVYAGTSAVLGIQSGEVKVYGILGRGEKELLVVDTRLPPQAKLVSERSSTVSGSITAGKRELPSTRSKESDSKTNSTTSTVSDSSTKTSSTGLTVDTQSAPKSTPSPTTPEAMEELIGDLVTPVSPVDFKSPNLFFGPFMGQTPDPGSNRESLKSTATQLQIIEDYEIGDNNEIIAIIDESKTSSVFHRPQSPKSRNASRNRSRTGEQRERRPTPDAMEETIGDIVTPMSPVDFKSPNLFFGPFIGQTPDPGSNRESLKSTAIQPHIIEEYEIGDDNEIIAIIDEIKTSRVFHRPQSPKSRNASRNRSRTGEQRERRPTPFVGNGDGDVKMTDPPAAHVRPPSPKSRNCSRTRDAQYQHPALVSHDLAQEPQITGRSCGIKPSPHSATAIPDHYQQIFVDEDLGPRARHLLPRPKSMVW